MIEISVLDEADEDMVRAATWYQEHRPERLPKLLSEYRATVERAIRFPHLGSPVTEIKPEFVARRFWLKDFPYAVMIGVLPRKLVIFAITHERQDEKHWQRRLVKVLR